MKKRLTLLCKRHFRAKGRVRIDARHDYYMEIKYVRVTGPWTIAKYITITIRTARQLYTEWKFVVPDQAHM